MLPLKAKRRKTATDVCVYCNLLYLSIKHYMSHHSLYKKNVLHLLSKNIVTLCWVSYQSLSKKQLELNFYFYIYEINLYILPLANQSFWKLRQKYKISYALPSAMREPLNPLFSNMIS